jgi:hypothetical protein
MVKQSVKKHAIKAHKKIKAELAHLAKFVPMGLVLGMYGQITPNTDFIKETGPAAGVV